MPNYKQVDPFKDMNDRTNRVMDTLTGGPGPKKLSSAQQLANFQRQFGNLAWVQEALNTPNLNPNHRALLDLLQQHGINGLADYAKSMERLKRGSHG